MAQVKKAMILSKTNFFICLSSSRLNKRLYRFFASVFQFLTLLKRKNKTGFITKLAVGCKG